MNLNGIIKQHGLSHNNDMMNGHLSQLTVSSGKMFKYLTWAKIGNHKKIPDHKLKLQVFLIKIAVEWQNNILISEEMIQFIY